MNTLLPLCAVFAAACGTSSSTDPGGIVCTAIAAAGLNVSVVDSITNQPMALTAPWATAREGTYVDSTASFFPDAQTGSMRTALAFERAGTYSITVHADGYKNWIKSGIVVTKDVCHVVGVLVTARLVK